MNKIKITYSGIARFFIGLFGIWFLAEFIYEINKQIANGEFNLIGSGIGFGFLGFIFLYATITGNAPFGLFEPNHNNVSEEDKK
jgi:hypothetical protein